MAIGMATIANVTLLAADLYCCGACPMGVPMGKAWVGCFLALNMGLMEVVDAVGESACGAAVLHVGDDG